MSSSPSIHASERALKRLKKRHARERRFKIMGLSAIAIAVMALIWLLYSVVGTGYKAFYQHSFTLDVEMTESIIDPSGARDPDALRKSNYRRIVQNAMYERFPDVTDRKAKKELFDLISTSGAPNHLRQMAYNDPSVVGPVSYTHLTLPTTSRV